jgi:ABC-type multidrug transport system fused ATPase/permease subunit
MTEFSTTNALLSRLWHHINPNRKRQLCAVSVLMLLSTAAELVSIGAVIPFLGVLIAPERVFSHPAFEPVVNAMSLIDPSQLVMPITLMFMFAAMLSGTVRIALLWGQTRLGSAIGMDFAFEAYRRTLNQPYKIHALRNSSEVASVLVSKVHIVITNIVLPVITLLSSVIFVLAVVLFMLIVEPEITLAAMLSIGGAYLLIAKISGNYLRSNGERVSKGLTIVSRLITEGLGAIRDVILRNSQKAVLSEFRKEEAQLRRSNANIAILAAIPRPVIETLAIVLFAGLVCIVSMRPDGIMATVPALGAIALAMQRILPMIQQVYSTWSSVTSGIPSLRDVLLLLDQPLVDHSKSLQLTRISFKHEVNLRDLRFRYNFQSSWILNGVNLQITRGSRIGIIGTTGSGKSTLLDIFLGLLMPTSGSLTVDGIEVNESNTDSWQAHIAHVPQSIYLLDASIAENIAFGVAAENLDHERVRMAAESAQIAKTIESWPNRYNTMVGECGIRLSGGQRQRIGIARALYQEADILVFDEATSSLDVETETALVEAINSLDIDLTMIIVAHRLSTLKACTHVVHLENGQIASSGSFNEVVSNSKFERIS